MDNATPTACPISGSTDIKHRDTYSFRKGIRLDLYECAESSHIWLHTTDEQQKLIEETYSEEYAGFRDDPYFHNAVVEEFGQRVSKDIPDGSKILDIGCGNGAFLKVAQDMGYDVMGVDVSEAAAEMCQKIGVNAVSGNFLTMDFPGDIKLATMWDVMEHLRQPMPFLYRAYDIIAPDGALLLKIPHYGELNFKILKFFKSKSSILLASPDHIQFYTRKSLELALKEAGFTSVEWYPSRQFREPAPTKSMKRKIARAVTKVIYQMAGNGNFFCLARKQS